MQILAKHYEKLLICDINKVNYSDIVKIGEEAMDNALRPSVGEDKNVIPARGPSKFEKVIFILLKQLEQ